MEEYYQQAIEWIEREERVCRQGRIDRLIWLASKMPRSSHFVFSGGCLAKYLFEEARHCFIFAQFLAVVVLGFAFIERTLAAMFYGVGRSDLERASASTLLREAVTVGWLSMEEHEWLDRARQLRNPVTHFRKPLHEDIIDFRSVTDNVQPYSLLEEDARHVLLAVMRLLGKVAV